MTATEELRRLLDERGVEWIKPSKDNERWTHWHGCDGNLFTASEDARGCVWIGGSVTPAWAVEATLGRGTLTAEQVRELIAPHLHAIPTFDFGRHGAVWKADFQAIADELNAELGRGECRVESMHGFTDPFVGTGHCVELSCHTIDDWRDSEPPAFCPYCGRKVVEE